MTHCQAEYETSRRAYFNLEDGVDTEVVSYHEWLINNT